MKEHYTAFLPFSSSAPASEQIRAYCSKEFSEAHFSKIDFSKLPVITERKRKSYPQKNRQTLCKVLQKQMPEDKCTPLQKQHLNALAEKKTFTVTTGHQLNFFGGPVYSIYKVLETIKTASECNSRYPDSKFVPVFWMASEDHDFEEIRSFYTEGAFFTMDAASGMPVGRIHPEHIPDDKIHTAFSNTENGVELFALFRKAYNQSATLAEATRSWMQEVFGDYGLLILDADDADLKECAAELFYKDLFEQIPFQTISPKAEKLEKEYGQVQVQPRECNLFLLTDIRDRIDPAEKGFRLKYSGRFISDEEMESLLKTHPEKFSPNALLRPVYQEILLPNIAYIGGTAEVMYWEELDTIFDALALPKPFLQPRNSFTFLSSATVRILEKNEISPEAILNDAESELRNYLKQHFPGEEALQRLRTAVEAAFENLISEYEKNLPHLADSAEAFSVRTETLIRKMEKKLLRAEKKEQRQKLESLARIWKETRPEGVLQERILNWSYFYGRNKDFLADVYNLLQIENPGMHIVEF